MQFLSSTYYDSLIVMFTNVRASMFVLTHSSCHIILTNAMISASALLVAADALSVWSGTCIWWLQLY